MPTPARGSGCTPTSTTTRTAKIDPDGREYQVAGSDAFKAKVASDIKWLASKPAGAAMVNTLSDKKTPMVTIVETKGENRTDSNDNRASFKGEPQGSTISYNADNKTGPAPDVNGIHERPPAVGLGHEISHGNAFGRGRTRPKMEAMPAPSTEAKRTPSRMSKRSARSTISPLARSQAIDWTGETENDSRRSSCHAP